MTGKPHIHPFFPEDRLPERKGDPPSPREAGQFLGPPCPPRPKLRGNVVDHGDPPLVHLFPHPVVEIGKIDEEERAHVGARCAAPPRPPPPRTPPQNPAAPPPPPPPGPPPRPPPANPGNPFLGPRPGGAR